MSALLDELSPTTIGEDKIVVALANPSEKILAFVGFQVSVDYSACLPSGVVPPLEVFFTGASGVQRRVFYETPSVLVFTASASGPHLILVRELHHNEWQGRLVVNVVGD